MKKSIITVCIACATLSGCVDLMQEPQSFLTPENIEYSEENVVSLTNGLYKTLWWNNWGFNCRPQILGLGADDLIGGSPQKRHYIADELMIDGTTFNGDTETVWQNMYAVIQGCSQLLEGLTVTTDLPEDKKKQYMGEAHFMRAFAYFQLVRWFGDVPGFTDSKCTADILGNTNITRNKVEDIYNLIIIRYH